MLSYYKSQFVDVSSARRFYTFAAVSAAFLIVAVSILAIASPARAQFLDFDHAQKQYRILHINTKRVSTGDSDDGLIDDFKVDREISIEPRRSGADPNKDDDDSQPYEWEPGGAIPTPSPSKNLAIYEWKVCVGCNGMALYRLKRRERSGRLHYCLIQSNLTKFISRRMIGRGVLRIRRWHGPDDRYFDFIEYPDHGSVEIASGTYDTLTSHIYVDPSPKIGPHDPRLPGEKFPQTRWRYLKSAEVEKMNYARVRYAINEMYARYSRCYDEDAIDRYFKQFDWYRPGDGYWRRKYTDNDFTPIERANMLLLRHRRNKLLGKPVDWLTPYEDDFPDCGQ